MALNLVSTSHSNQQGCLQRFGLLLTEPSLFSKAVRKMLLYISSHHRLRAQPREKAAESVQSTGRKKNAWIYTQPLTPSPPYRKTHFSAINYIRLNSWLTNCGKGCYGGT